MGFEAPLWRALAVFRVISLGYAALLVYSNAPGYRHPIGGWLTLAVMVGWTAYAIWAFREPDRRRPPLLAADLLIAAGCLCVTALVESSAQLTGGTANLTANWVAGPVLAWAVRGGPVWGISAAAVAGLPDVAIRSAYGAAGVGSKAVDGAVLLFVGGLVIGYVARLGIDTEARLRGATEVAATTRERERLARGIHDSVLQVLTLVARRGRELGGEAAELGRLAGEQETALRTLIGGHVLVPPPRGSGAMVDLRPLLTAGASTTVTVSAPATPVRVSGRAATELTAAVGAALDNVRAHCGPRAKAWVLVEDSGSSVTVSVRDDGPGIPDGRLAQAAAAGRLGVAQSITGRIRDLGGTVSITSVPGEGTEIEMTVPAD